MKQIYICEKCGAQFEEYDDAYRCERGHINPQDQHVYDFERELEDKLTWRQGQRFPERVFFAVRDWDYATDEERRTIVAYKLEKELPATEVERRFAANEERKERERQEWEAECERRKAEKEAKEAAEQAV